jgi:hypothetical protein
LHQGASIVASAACVVCIWGCPATAPVGSVDAGLSPGGCRSSGETCGQTTDCCNPYLCITNSCEPVGTSLRLDGGFDAGPSPGCRTQGQTCGQSTDCCDSLACIDNACQPPPVTIEFFLSLQPTSSQNGGVTCSTTGNAEATGTLYTAPPAGASSYACCGYTTGIEVSNALPVDAGTMDPDEVTLDRMTATYSFAPTSPSPAVTLPNVTTPLTVTIPSDGSTTFVVPLLSASNGVALKGLAGSLSVLISLSGHSLGGTPISASAGLSIEVLNSPPPACQSPQMAVACGPDAYDQVDGFICEAP